jgi:hypothetical protein
VYSGRVGLFCFEKGNRYMSDILTPENFDFLIYAVIIVGLILAVRRLYQDFTRPLPTDDFTVEPQQSIKSIEENQKKG